MTQAERYVTTVSDQLNAIREDAMGLITRRRRVNRVKHCSTTVGFTPSEQVISDY